MGKAKTMLDLLNERVALERARKRGDITYDEWCHIRRNGTPEEIEEAVERMEAQGGYENLA